MLDFWGVIVITGGWHETWGSGDSKLNLRHFCMAGGGVAIQLMESESEDASTKSKSQLESLHVRPKNPTWIPNESCHFVKEAWNNRPKTPEKTQFKMWSSRKKTMRCGMWYGIQKLAPFSPCTHQGPPKSLITAKNHSSVILIASTGLKQIYMVASLPYNDCRWFHDMVPKMLGASKSLNSSCLQRMSVI